MRLTQVRDALLTIGAVIRLTRFVTEDSLARWTIRTPVQMWGTLHEIAAVNRMDAAEAAAYAEGDDPVTWQGKVAYGIDCPWCVGFHLSWLMMVGTLVVRRIPVLRTLWMFVLAALVLSEVVGRALTVRPRGAAE